MRQRIRVVYWAVLALRREYSIMELAVSNNNRTGTGRSSPGNPARAQLTASQDDRERPAGATFHAFG